MRLKPSFGPSAILVCCVVGLCACPAEEASDDGFGFVDSEGTPTTTATPVNDDGVGDDGPAGSDTSPDPTDGGGSTGDTSECGAAAHCASAVPDDWMGPVAIRRGLSDGSDAVACGEGYPSSGLTLLEGFNQPPAHTCECECSVNLASFCSVYVYDYAAGCSGFVAQLPMTDECSDLTVTGGTAFYLQQQGQPFCQPHKTDIKPEVQWDAMVSSCAGAEQGEACVGGGVCTPNAPTEYEGQLCIFSQGVHECPAGDFSEQHIFNNGADDSRACGPCTCGVGSATCVGSLDVFAAGDCSGEPQANVPSTFACNAATVGATSMSINFTTDPSCPVETPPEPAGEIVAAGEFTYCCEAP